MASGANPGPAPTWGSVPYATAPPGWGGLPPGAVYGQRPARRFRLRAVIFALVGVTGGLDRTDVDCFADVTSQVDVVDCRELHGSEVIGISRLPEVSGRLDRTDVDYFADGACRIAFRSYVGGNYDDSSLFFDALVPSDRAYGEGDRTVYCLIDSTDHAGGRGSVQGTG